MIDWTRPIQTRDGRKARVLCTDRKKEGWPVVVAITVADASGEEALLCYPLDGRSCRSIPHRDDIVNVLEEPITATWWININASYAVLYPSQSDANRKAGSDRIACVRVEIAYRPGQFDEEVQP